MVGENLERIEKYCYTKKDFRIEWFSGTGPGGQKKNKTQNSCRIIHLPSGLKVTGQNHRSRQQNFKEAFRNLGQKLEEWILNQISKETIQRTVSDEVVRTYHFADNRVVDHLSGVRTSIDTLEKDFGKLIEARRNVKRNG